MRILLVDDDVDIIECYQVLLGGTAIEVLSAGDGVAALDVLTSQQPIDFVVSDILMPRLDGLGLLSEIRRRWPAIKVILISGNADAIDEARRQGVADDVMEKPFNASALLNLFRHPERFRKPTAQG